MKKIIRSKLFWLGIAAIGTVYVFFGYLWYGSVDLQYTEDVKTIRINNTFMYEGNQRSESIKLRPGTHRLFAYGPRIDDVFMKISVSPFGKKQVSIEPAQLSEREVIEKVAKRGLPEDMEVGRGALLENNSWLVALIYSPQGRREGYTNIYSYNGTVWRLYDSGTGFDLEGYTRPGYPKSVVEYMERRME